MTRLTDSSWWWDVAFDGVASSLIATVVAVLGIWVALSHDRVMARDAELRQEFRQMRARSGELALLARDSSDVEGLVTLLERWRLDTFDLASECIHRDEDAMGVFLMEFAAAVPPSQNLSSRRERATTVLLHASRLLGDRLSRPGDFASMSREEAKAHANALVGGRR